MTLADQLNLLVKHVEREAAKPKPMSHQDRRIVEYEKAKEATWAALRDAGTISAVDLVERMNKPHRTVLKYLQDLKREGRARLVGSSAKTIKWEAK